VTLSGAWNHTELTNTPTLFGGNGQPIIFENLNPPLHNPYGDKGSPLAQSPPFQGNLQVRYEFPVMDYNLFVQGSAVRRGHVITTTDKLQTNPVDGSSIAYDLPGYTSYDASVGGAKDAWSVQLYAQNLTDKRAITFAQFTQRVREDSIIRPRTISLKVGYKF